MISNLDSRLKVGGKGLNDGLTLLFRLIGHRSDAHELPFFVSISDDDFFFVNDCPLGQAIEGDGTAKYLCL